MKKRNQVQEGVAEATSTLEIKKPTYEFKNFLASPKEGKKVKILPVANGGAYVKLFQNPEEAKNKTFLFDKCKKFFDVPLDPISGNVKRVLDNTERFFTKEFPNEPLTEQEFFEKILDVDLNPYTKTDNFWKVDPRAILAIDVRGLSLDLSNEIHYIQWKVALANDKKIAPNYESRKMSPSYLFYIVDEKVEKKKERESFSSKAKAFELYNKIKDSKTELEDVLRAAGKGLSVNRDMEWLQEQVEIMVDEKQSEFLNIFEDKFREDKIFISKAVEIGAIEKQYNKYILDTGVELGTLELAINWFKKPEHQEAKLRIKGLIESKLG